MTKAIDDVTAERMRQISVEGWTPEHDDEHDDGEMAMAAACYAEASVFGNATEATPSAWPWAPEWWKPSDQRRNLIKAAALIVAEIERLDRI